MIERHLFITHLTYLLPFILKTSRVWVTDQKRAMTHEFYDSIFKSLFETEDPTEPEFYSRLTAAIVRCFHIPDVSLSPFDQAQTILDSLFYHFIALKTSLLSFKVSDFLAKYIENRSDAKKILIALLYGLYYGDVELRKVHQGRKEGEFRISHAPNHC